MTVPPKNNETKKWSTRQHTANNGQVVQTFSHGRSHVVQVELKRRRRPLTENRATTEQGTLPTNAEKDARAQALERAIRSRKDEGSARKPYADPPLPPLYDNHEKKETRPTQATESLAKPLIALEKAETFPGATTRKDTSKRYSKAEEATPKANKKMLVRQMEERQPKNFTRFYDGEADELVSRRALRTSATKQPSKRGQLLQRTVTIPSKISLRELASYISEKPSVLVKKAHTLDIRVDADATLDATTAELILMDLGHKVVHRATDLERLQEMEEKFSATNDIDICVRPPVVTVMGHVDHGKTSLLDALRTTNVTSKEAGGITQHIGASRVKADDGRNITFIDTPGHAAFTAMRARGANITDIVILLVAADDGVKAQTVEAISHAKASGAPIIVVINKIDKPNANPGKVREELLKHDIVVENLGGDIQDVEVSAHTRQGLDNLLEALLLQADILELKANLKAPARGVVLEAKKDKRRGVLATVLVRDGILKKGDIFVAGTQTGRARALTDDRGKTCQEAGPGVPVEIMGMGEAPLAGDTLLATYDEQGAQEIARLRQRHREEKATASQEEKSFDNFLEQDAQSVKTLSIVLRGDTQGSLEAVESALLNIKHDEVAVKVLHKGVGAPSESDLHLAQASGASIVAFNVPVGNQFLENAKRMGIDVQRYDIIYKLLDNVRGLLAGLLSPIKEEVQLGIAEVRQIFVIKKMGQVAGCHVKSGLIKRDALVRVKRQDAVLFETSIMTLKREQNDVKEVKAGYECGIMLNEQKAFQVGDVLEVFELANTKRSLEDTAS